MDRTGNTENDGGKVGRQTAPAQTAPAQTAPDPDVVTDPPSAGRDPAEDYKPLPWRSSEFWFQFPFLFISVLLSGFSAFIYASRPSYGSFTSIPVLMYPAGAAFLLAMVSSSFLLLIQWRYTFPKLRIFGVILFAAQLAVVIISAIKGSISAPSLSALFSVVAFGFLGMVVGLWVAVMLWVRNRSFAESAFLGLLGVMLAILCLPGILFFAKPLNTPEEMTSEVYVFATGTSTQRLSVDIVFNPSSSVLFLPSGASFSPGEEAFTIHNGSDHIIHWAALLDNDACFTTATFGQVPAKITHRAMNIDANLFTGSIIVPNPDDYFPTPAQLFTGVLAGNSSETFTGTVSGIFETSIISRRAAYLPTYSQGTLSGVSQNDRKMIINGLGSAPTARHDGAFTITLTGGEYDPSLESLSDAEPSVESTPQSEGIVQWTGQESIFNPQYKVSSQNGTDEATDGLFVFAAFLGIAGAGLLSSSQAVVKLLSSRRPLHEDRQAYARSRVPAKWALTAVTLLAVTLLAGFVVFVSLIP